MLSLYNAALFPIRTVAGLWAFWATRRDPTRQREWDERLARIVPQVRPGGVWIHGASLGEAGIVRQLAAEIRGLNPSIPLLLSGFTVAGRLGLPKPPDVDATFFFPLDFPWGIRRVLGALAPRAVVIVETELWPNLLQQARERGIPIALLNARLAPERMRRYRRLEGLYRPLLGLLGAIGAQTEEDARRFCALGADPRVVTVTGNVKYDRTAPTAAASTLRARFGLPDGRPVVAAGSTAEGEDPLVLDAFLQARRGAPGLFLILAPRHADRFVSAAREAASRGIILHRLSSGEHERAGATDGLLVDTLGELAGLYPLARAAFVGGSLVPVGGHNLLEPAVCGVPVLFGPHTHHVREIAANLVRIGGGLIVTDPSSLAAAWLRWVHDPQERDRAGAAAEGLVQRNRGALKRSVDLVAPWFGTPS